MGNQKDQTVQKQLQTGTGSEKPREGRFLCGTRTTKTVCRPSCPAKNCNNQNLVIFKTLEEALQAGYRPCLRCRPDLPDWEGSKKELAKAASALIEEHYKDKFSLDSLSSTLFVNRSYLSRTFKEQTGHTLLWYHNYIRCQKAAALLARPELSLSFIGSETGFCSASHFTKIFREYLGCTPSEYRRTCLNYSGPNVSSEEKKEL